MMRNTGSQLLRRCREFSSASQIGPYFSQLYTQAMEKIADSLALKATLCGVGGYVLGGLIGPSLTESDLEAEQTLIGMFQKLEKTERTVERIENMRRSRTSL